MSGHIITALTHYFATLRARELQTEMSNPSAFASSAYDGEEPVIDLADGYAELEPAFTTPPDLFATLAGTAQPVLQQRFLDAYAQVAGEKCAVADVLFAPSASQAISAVARMLARGGARTIGVPEPTFDSLPGLLRQAGLEPVPLRESEADLLAAVTRVDVVYLVLPNNPTGWAPADETLARLAGLAREHGRTVVIDRTSRFHQDRQFTAVFDLDFDWIDILDTGKTWSAAGAKVAFVRARSGERLSALREDLDLHFHGVAPVHFWAATEAIRSEQGVARLRATVAANRGHLLAALGPLGFTLVSQPLGVALLRLPAGCDMDSAGLAEKLAVAGIRVIPGRAFYWSAPKTGRAYLRVALVRPVPHFRASIEALADAVRSLI
jgi:aspartate/methionine/tyrosine aminotransferase